MRLAILVILCVAMLGCSKKEHVSVTWSQTASLSQGRYGFTATVLDDKSVIVIGGQSGPGQVVRTVERFNAATLSWSVIANTPEPLRNHTATLIGEDAILVVGGGPSNDRFEPSGDPSNHAWVFHPSTATFTQTGSLSVARSHHVAITLSETAVLIAGGSGAFGASLASAEIYDVTRGTFSTTAPMNAARSLFSGVSTAEGTAFVAGGVAGSMPLASAEAFNVAAHTWTPTISITTGPRQRHAMAAVGEGILLVGGRDAAGYVSDALTFNGAWHPIAQSAPAMDGTLTTVDEDALWVGGLTDVNATPAFGLSARVQVLDHASGAWIDLSSLSNARRLHVTVPIIDQEIVTSVLVIGGVGASGALSACELGTIVRQMPVMTAE